MRTGFSLLALCASTAAILIATGHTTPSQPSDTPRTPTELCDEVAHELNNQYVEGLIDRDRAKSIIDRCYATFT